MLARLSLIAAPVTALVVLASALPAAAACKTMGFTVNDYGKDGPTKDAKELLDKDIAKWAADTGIAKYTVGKKTVKCELFLDVILFDEHTCTASASVCWGGETPDAGAKKVKDEAAAPAKSPTKAAKTEEKKSEAPPVETGAIKHETAAPVVDDKPADAPPAVATAPTETAPEAKSDSDAAERAAAAAERAAAAAERAAAAAEKAAAASAAHTAPASTAANEPPVRLVAPDATAKP